MDVLLLYLFSFFLIFDLKAVSGLLCYECDNKESPECGEHFKPYQFRPVHCGDDSIKCAIQRQPPNKDNWIGILRGCYRPGQLPGINETNGCRYWESQGDGFKALYCFCDRDYCNSAPSSSFRTRTFLVTTIPSMLIINSINVFR